jgi:hypothetical protein
MAATNTLRRLPVALLGWLLFAAASPAAQIFFNDVVTIEFHPQKVSREVAWSDQMELTADGLTTRGPVRADSSREFWIRTPPMAAGFSWRPPTQVSVDLTITDLRVTGSISYINAFARYGADRVHWSSWIPLTAPTRDTRAHAAFQGQLALPAMATAQYRKLMAEWFVTEPPWGSDEHAYCVWLAATHPEFFATEIPHMGYIQLLIEGEAASLRAGGMVIRLSAGMSGMSVTPRGPRRANADEKWFFDLTKTAF